MGALGEGINRRIMGPAPLRQEPDHLKNTFLQEKHLDIPDDAMLYNNKSLLCRLVKQCL